MRKVILNFPDTISLSEFLLMQRMSRVIVDSSSKTLSGLMSEDQVKIACKTYGAKLRQSSAVKSSSRK